MTVREAINTAKSALPQIDSIGKEVLRFFAKELNCRVEKLIAFDETEIDSDRLAYLLQQRSEHIPFESLCGSIGITRSTRYTLVPRVSASLSSGEFSGT